MSVWSSNGSEGGIVDISDVLDPGSLDAIVQMVSTGALVSIGLSRDAGALSCTVTLDGEWTREWFRDGAALTTWLGARIADVQSAAQAPAPSGRATLGQNARRQPSRSRRAAGSS